MKVIAIADDMERCVTYIAHAEESRECVVVDPGQSGDVINRYLNSFDLQCGAILLTHGHYDHILGLDELVSTSKAPVYIHVDDAKMPSDPHLNVSELFYEKAFAPTFSHFKTVSHGDHIAAAGLDIKVIHTPGHTPGSVVYRISSNGQESIFSGDTVFKETVGRWDLPGGNGGVLRKTITMLRSMFGDDVLIYPGHGESTNFGFERRHNMFFQLD